MNRRAYMFLMATAFVIAACGQAISLILPPSADVTVYSLDAKTHRTLEPGSPAHTKLASWLAANQKGWSQYFATPPSQGVTVRAHGLNLQVIGTTVLAHTPDGVVSKSFEPDELAFLLQ